MSLSFADLQAAGIGMNPSVAIDVAKIAQLAVQDMASEGRDFMGTPFSAGSGGGVTAAPGNYAAQIVVAAGQSLQAAIDSAPASADLIKSFSGAGITSPSANVYAVATTQKPAKVFVDAFEFVENAGFFNPDGSAVAAPATFQYFWKWDSANNRVLLASASAVTQVTCARYAAIIAVDRPSYDAVTLRPGIVIVGLKNLSEIRPVTSVINATRPSIPVEYAVSSASYSGLVNFTIIRNARITTIPFQNCCGLLFPSTTDSDAFFLEDCRLLVESSFQKYADISYSVGIFFQTGEQDAPTPPRAKNVTFIRTPLTAEAPVDIFETMSGNFNGLVRMYSCPIDGSFFIDGETQTFKFYDCPIRNINSRNNIALPIQEASALAFNFVGPGATDPFPGESYGAEFYGCSIYVERTQDPAIAADPFFAFAWDGKSGFKFVNSRLVAENFIGGNGGTPINATAAAKIFALGSDLPPLALADYSTASRTPLVPTSYTTNVRQNTNANELTFGAFSMTYENLKARKGAIVQIRGSFAANANNKQLRLKHGLSGAVAQVKQTAGAYNTGDFVLYANITFDKDVVNVQLTSTCAAFSDFFGVYRQALTAGQIYALNFSCVGVASGDIVINSQQIDVAG